MTDAPRAYELWDRFSGNQVMDFETEEEALTFVRGEMESDEDGGEDPTTSRMTWWALMHIKADGTQTKIAGGKELLDRARGAKP